jgi:hypothetical protein
VKLWVNEDRTVMVAQRAADEDNGTLMVATRPEPGAVWGPPVEVKPERA